MKTTNKNTWERAWERYVDAMREHGTESEHAENARRYARRVWMNDGSGEPSFLAGKVQS